MEISEEINMENVLAPGRTINFYQKRRDEVFIKPLRKWCSNFFFLLSLAELYFLIVKFLSRSPFEETYKVMKLVAGIEDSSKILILPCFSSIFFQVLVNELEKFKVSRFLCTKKLNNNKKLIKILFRIISHVFHVLKNCQNKIIHNKFLGEPNKNPDSPRKNAIFEHPQLTDLYFYLIPDIPEASGLDWPGARTEFS